MSRRKGPKYSPPEKREREGVDYGSNYADDGNSELEYELPPVVEEPEDEEDKDWDMLHEDAAPAECVAPESPIIPDVPDSCGRGVGTQCLIDGGCRDHRIFWRFQYDQ